jgi:hypothetical protein
MGLIFFIFNAQTIATAKLAKCVKHTDDYEGYNKLVIQLTFFVKKLITPKVDIPDVIDTTNNLYGMMKLMYANTNKIIQMLKRTHSKDGFVHTDETLSKEKLSKDYTTIL